MQSSKNFEKDIKKARDLISSANKILMFYDTDCDGSTSYFQLKNTFESVVGFPLTKDSLNQIDFFNTLGVDDYDLVVIFDIPFLTKDFFDYFKDKKILWADHHPSNDSNLIKEHGDCLNLNPLNYDLEDSRSSSYLAYRICNKKENLFYATIGTLGDIALLDIIIDLYDYNRKQFNLLFNKLPDKKRKEIFDFIKNNDFKYEGKIKEKMEYVYYLGYMCGHQRFKNLIDFMYKIEDSKIVKALNILAKLPIEELVLNLNLNDKFPFDEYYKIKEEYEILRNKAIKTKLKKNILFFEYESDVGFSMTLSDEMNYKFSSANYVVMAHIRKDKERVQCSFRSWGTNVAEIASKAGEGLDVRSGGHPNACGARISLNDYEIFKKRLLS